jgi:DMSO/TMAO reductase YedYZ molybdopterin-dependent catalytic subunit
MSRQIWTRRQMLVRGSLGFAGMILAGCDRLNQAPTFRRVLDHTEETLTQRAQRLLLRPGQALAPEFRVEDLSPVFRSNGTSMPDTPAYQRILADDFASWALQVDGLVMQPQQLSLRALRALPARTQITRHDCVEGWSAIGKWTGVPLSTVLNLAQPLPNVRYVVLHCADSVLRNGSLYYESIDLIDAYHPQTLLAYELNGKALPVPNGAPLRLRVERQLGYKQAKYIMRIEAVEALSQIQGGKGGFWEDIADYQWYAGI